MSALAEALRPTWPLKYVCAFCAKHVATFKNVRAHEPATLSVCDDPKCRAQASARYKATT